MKLFWSWMILLPSLAVCQNATQQAQIVRALALIQTMPNCSRTCLLAGVAAAGISTTNLDLTASCSNTTTTDSITACSKATCTIREQLTSKNITETLCERPVRESPPISVASLIGVSLVVVAYLMRMASRITFPCERGVRNASDYFWWDDYMITFAFLLIIPITVLSNMLTSMGVGRDVWTIPADTLPDILKIYYVDEVLYLTGLPVIKIAILLTYLRIFQSQRFRQLVFGAIGLNVAYAITFILITIFQCTPVNLAWWNWDGEHQGACNNINAQSWASAALNIALDVVVVGLPMPMLWNMNLSKRKKALVMLMFGVGFFVTFVSILRLQMLVRFGNSTNLTHDYKQVGYWTVIEVDTALCCACMPGIRNLLRRAFPRVLGLSSFGLSDRTPTPGLSGRTAIGTSIDKSGHEVFVRPKHNDDSFFIPLENVRTKDFSTHEMASSPAITNHVRNFSHPSSRPPSTWREPVSPV